MSFKGKTVDMSGQIPIELPSGYTVEAELKVATDGKVTLEFVSPEFANDMIVYEVRGNLMGFQLDYMAAKAATDED